MKRMISAAIAMCLAGFSGSAAAQHHHVEPSVSATPPAPPAVDHSKMDHSKMDHSQMEDSKVDHSKMDHSKMDHSQMQSVSLPVVTDADRQAAFPEVHAHHKHGTDTYSYWLMDRLEVAKDDALAWEGMGWIGGDVQKVLFRTEGHAQDGKVEEGSAEVLYSRGLRAWWDVVAGVRQDFGEGPGRTWAAIGIQGLAPYKFETSATLYVGNKGRAKATFEAEYETLLTNRLIVQWRGEANLSAKDDPQTGMGSGLTSASAGIRLRYEINRHFAPYIGVEHEKTFGGTANYRMQSGHETSDTSVVAGIRFWF